MIVCNDKRRFRRHLSFLLWPTRRPWNALQIFTFDPHFRCCPPSAGRLSSQARCCCLSLVTPGGVSGRRQHSHCYSPGSLVSARLICCVKSSPPTLINSKQIGAHRAAVHIHPHHTLSLLVLLVRLRLLLLLAANARLVFLSPTTSPCHCPLASASCCSPALPPAIHLPTLS